MSTSEDVRRREMDRIIEEDLEEDLLRCPVCGDRDCLGLCQDPEYPETEADIYA